MDRYGHHIHHRGIYNDVYCDGHPLFRERFKFCVNRKTDIRYVISYRGQNLFFRVLSLFVL